MGVYVEVERIIVGMLGANCYIMYCPGTREAVIVDPGGDGEKIVETVESLRLTVKCIVNTHGHADHTAANSIVKEATGAPIAIHKDDAYLLEYSAQKYWYPEFKTSKPDILLDDGETIEFNSKYGPVRFRVIHTPGHTAGSICLYRPGSLFSGDTVFRGGIGRVDLASSKPKLMPSSLRKILSLPDETRIFPGHGPETTVGMERRNIRAMILSLQPDL